MGAGYNGNAIIITSDSIRNGQNKAAVSGNGVSIKGNNEGIYFDNPASHTRNADGEPINSNPISLQGDAGKGLGGFSFNINGNCGGTCLGSGSFGFTGTTDQAAAALKKAGAWDYGVADWIDGSYMPIFGHHPNTEQFRFGSGPSSHFSLPYDFLAPSKYGVVPNPKATVPASGDFHVDPTVGRSHFFCANFGLGC